MNGLPQNTRRESAGCFVAMRKTASAVRRAAVRRVVASTGGGEQNRVAEQEKAGGEKIGCGRTIGGGESRVERKTGGRSCAAPRFCQFFGVFRMRDVTRGKTLDKRGKSCYNEGNPNAMRERSTSKDGSKRARAGESRAARVGGITLRSSKPNSAGARLPAVSRGAVCRTLRGQRSPYGGEDRWYHGTQCSSYCGEAVFFVLSKEKES